LKQIFNLEIDYNGGKELNINGNTCFFDSSGLLCINIDMNFKKDQKMFSVLKQYCLKDRELIKDNYTQKVEKAFIVENRKLYLPIRCILETYGYSVSWDSGQKELLVKGNNITDLEFMNTVYETVVIKTIPGYYWSRNGLLTKAEVLGKEYENQFSCTDRDDYIRVREGEQYRFTFYGSWFQDVGTIVFLDKDDKLIKAYFYSSSTKLKDEIIIVPNNAKKMHLSLFTNQEYKVDKVVTIRGVDLTTITKSQFEKNLLSVLDENQGLKIKAEEADITYDKAYITFVLDDCRPDMDIIADIFHKYEIPLCIAAIPQNLNNVVQSGKETIRQVCDRVVLDGGEILAHHGNVITEAAINDFDVMFEHFFSTKQELSAYGYDVNGIILAGGTGQIVGSSFTDKWARQYYSYSDLYGMKKYGIPYYHPRYWLANNVSTYKKVIKSAINNKEWITFYFHDTNEVSMAKLNEILSYINKFSNKELEVITYHKLNSR
jgi:hypothetical protein